MQFSQVSEGTAIGAVALTELAGGAPASLGPGGGGDEVDASFDMDDGAAAFRKPGKELSGPIDAARRALFNARGSDLSGSQRRSSRFGSPVGESVAELRRRLVSRCGAAQQLQWPTQTPATEDADADGASASSQATVHGASIGGGPSPVSQAGVSALLDEAESLAAERVTAASWLTESLAIEHARLDAARRGVGAILRQSEARCREATATVAKSAAAVASAEADAQAARDAADAAAASEAEARKAAMTANEEAKLVQAELAAAIESRDAALREAFEAADAARKAMAANESSKQRASAESARADVAEKAAAQARSSAAAAAAALSSGESKLADALAQVKQLTASREADTQRLNDAVEQRNAARDDRDRLSARVAELEAALEKESSSAADLRRDLDARVEAAVVDSARARAELEAQVARLTEEVNAAPSTIREQTQLAVAAVAVERDEFRDRCDKAAGEASELSRRLEEAEAGAAERQHRIEELEHLLAEATKAKHENESVGAAAAERQAADLARLEEVQNAARVAARQAQEVTKQKVLLIKELSEMRSSVSDAQTRLRTAEASHAAELRLLRQAVQDAKEREARAVEAARRSAIEQERKDIGRLERSLGGPESISGEVPLTSIVTGDGHGDADAGLHGSQPPPGGAADSASAAATAATLVSSPSKHRKATAASPSSSVRRRRRNHTQRLLSAPVRLVRCDGGIIVPLSSGEDMLGRGKRTGINDVHVSRRALKVVVSKTQESVCVIRATAIGVAPIYVRRAHGGEPLEGKPSPRELLRRGSPTELLHGDCIIFAERDDAQFRVDCQPVLKPRQLAPPVATTTPEASKRQRATDSAVDTAVKCGESRPAVDAGGSSHAARDGSKDDGETKRRRLDDSPVVAE